MSELKLKFQEYTLPNEELPLCSRLNILELVGHLDFHTSARCMNYDAFKYKERLKQHIVQTFEQKLYGGIIRAIDEAECETQANRFNYSFSAEQKMEEAFQKLRKSIPEITYD